MTKRVFIDSSAWISYTIEPDSNHTKALNFFKHLAQDKSKLFTSTFILDESITKLRKVLGQKRTNLFFLNIKELVSDRRLEILEVKLDEVEKSAVLLDRYPTPNTFSITDATNIVLCQKYRIKTLFSFDSDFRKLKISNLQIIP